MRTAPPLEIWTVYARPRDFPDSFVARRFVILPGGRTGFDDDVLRADTLADVRALLPPGLYRLPRDPADDPVIVETWV